MMFSNFPTYQLSYFPKGTFFLVSHFFLCSCFVSFHCSSCCFQQNLTESHIGGHLGQMWLLNTYFDKKKMCIYIAKYECYSEGNFNSFNLNMFSYSRKRKQRTSIHQHVEIGKVITLGCPSRIWLQLRSPYHYLLKNVWNLLKIQVGQNYHCKRFNLKFHFCYTNSLSNVHDS